MCPGQATNNFAGWSVALSADGTTALVGAYGGANGQGWARAYKFIPSTARWDRLGTNDNEMQGLTAPAQFGISVSLSAGTFQAGGA